MRVECKLEEINIYVYENDLALLLRCLAEENGRIFLFHRSHSQKVIFRRSQIILFVRRARSFSLVAVQS